MAQTKHSQQLQRSRTKHNSLASGSAVGTAKNQFGVATPGRQPTLGCEGPRLLKATQTVQVPLLSPRYRAKQLWINMVKAATRSLEGGKQHKDVYNLSLIQLEQQREVTQTGALMTLMTKRSMVTCSATAIKAGALPRVLKRSRVMDAGCVQPVKDVIIDLCAGRQSMERPSRQMGYRYVAVELKAVIRAVRGN